MNLKHLIKQWMVAAFVLYVAALALSFARNDGSVNFHAIRVPLFYGFLVAWLCQLYQAAHFVRFFQPLLSAATLWFILYGLAFLSSFDLRTGTEHFLEMLLAAFIAHLSVSPAKS